VPKSVQEAAERDSDYDHTVLLSDGATPRWRNTAQWARNTLREDGLIRDDTPRSIWEIAERGREWLVEQT
jgi:restriction system protein